jgi:hypothetical protein
MTAFFIPGISSGDDGRALELAYGDMRTGVELDMGRRPRARRIEKLWTRRGSIDCLTVLGRPDPLRGGGTVMAIFDMGTYQPFVVWREADISTGGGCPEILNWSAYSVMEFDP